MIPAAAMAQGNPGPYGGLFGRTPNRAGQDHTTVEVRSTLGVMFDNALLPAEDQAGKLQSGFSSGAGVNLLFQHATERLTGTLSGGASRQEYFTTPGFGTNLFGADARLKARLATRLEAEAVAAYVHSPYFQFLRDFGTTTLTPSDNLMPYSSYAAEMLENETIDAIGSLTGQLSKRSRLSASVNRRQTRFAHHPDHDFVLDGYHGSWNTQLRRDLSLRAGYGRERIEQRGTDRGLFDHEIIDVGIDFNRELSVARRTTLGLMTSTSFFKGADTERRFRVNAAARLSKQFRRTWRATAYASRNTEFWPGFVEPVLTDSVGASLGGMFSRRVNWMAGVVGSKGEYGFSDLSGFKQLAATSGLHIALSRHFGLYSQYVAYWYEIPPGSSALALVPRLDRQTVAIGLTAYLPLYTKMRPPRDSR